MLEPTRRFSDRVEDYVKYRPGYPAGLLPWLEGNAGMGPSSDLADVGSGTGIFALFVAASVRSVAAVEPNEAMRVQAESLFSGRPGIRSVAGSAESTGLPSASVDLVTAAQAFHWFDIPSALAEFRRILRPGGRLVLVWNSRLSDTPFLKEYEALLSRLAPEYGKVAHQKTLPEGKIASCFASGMKKASFENHQDLDLEGLLGRMQSSSYVPAAGTPGHEEIRAAAARAFGRHQEGGRVQFRYRTDCYAGGIAEALP